MISVLSPCLVKSLPLGRSLVGIIQILERVRGAFGGNIILQYSHQEARAGAEESITAGKKAKEYSRSGNFTH